MAGTMRAAQYDKETDQILVREVPIPEPGEGQYLVQIRSASLCHSDVAVLSQRPDGLGPVTIGHEGCGIIAKIHPSVQDKGFEVGSRVGLLYVIDACLECEGCQLHSTFCVNPRNGGAKIQGLQAPGYCAEYAVADWYNAIRLPSNLPMDKASPLFCAGITAFHAVDKCQLEAGKWLAVVGCGGLGQLAIRYAKAMKLKVIALDIDGRMLTRAKDCGADVAFNTKTNKAFHKEIRKLTGIRGCHAAAVFSSSHAAYGSAQRVLTFNGVLMVVGLPETPLQLPAVAVSLGLIRVRGASNGSVFEAQKAIDFSATHSIVPDVTFRKLDEMPKMFEDMKQGNVERRMVVLFGGEQSKL